MVQQQITKDLIYILDNHPVIKEELKNAIKKAALDIYSIDDYLKLVDDTAKYIPVNMKFLNEKQMDFYYIIDQSKILKENTIFLNWMNKFSKDWGQFLDSPESTKYLKNFFDDPKFHIDNYAVSPSGWMTFNQFFARQMKSGKRKIDSICDNNIIVSPVDGIFLGHWHINNSMVEAKGVKFSIIDLLNGSSYQSKFDNGIFTHLYLDIMDYHRFHTSVAGTIKEIRKIPGDVMFDIIKDDSGQLKSVDGIGFQVIQDRGLMILDTNNSNSSSNSDIGMIALIPVGMAQVSSVNLTPDVESYLSKGQEFGFFAFGGSDIIILFEHKNITFTAEKNTHYNQGSKIAEIKN